MRKAIPTLAWMTAALSIGCAASEALHPADAAGMDADAVSADIGAGGGLLDIPTAFDDGPDSAPGEPDDGPDSAPDGPGDDVPGTGAPPGGCVSDGALPITSDEVPAVGPGLSTLYTVNSPGTTTTVPTPASGPVWAFDGAQSATDTVLTDTIIDVTTQWYAGHFADADYAQALDADGANVGVYRRDPQSGDVLLLGLASVAEGVTALRYATPVVVLSFPLEPGRAWSDLAREAIGLLDGIAYPLEASVGGTVRLWHSYESSVESAGTVVVPAGTFEAVMVHTAIELKAVNDAWPGPIGVTTRFVRAWIAECAPLLARVRSKDDESSADFAVATEYRRFGDATR